MSSYLEGQTHQVMEALESAGCTPAHLTTLGQLPQEKIAEILMVLDGKAKIVPIESDDTDIIYPNRTTPPTYPDWVKEVLHPELELTGPAKYNISQVEQWLHKDQKGNKQVGGRVIYKYLKDNQMLRSCISLADLLAIQAKGIDFFRQHFAGKDAFGWKSVVWHRDGSLHAPYLFENGDEVVLNWHHLEHVWHDYSPALRFIG